MKAHIADDKWDQAEKVVQKELKKQQLIGFSAGMKSDAAVINNILKDHTKSLESKLQEIQTHVDWCLQTIKEKDEV